MEFEVNETEHDPEEQELMKEMEKEQTLADITSALITEREIGFCSTCSHTERCDILRIINEKIKIRNSIYKIEQIEPIEDRWGCTSHKPKEAVLLPEANDTH